jgi:hypothetical protein
MELLLGQWDASKGVAALFDAKLKEAFLSELAYKLHDQRVAEIQADDLLDSVARYFSEQGLDRGERNAKVVAFVHELSGRNSVLATRRSAYYFRHHSYQEYFAARFAERMRFSPESVVSRALDDWWNNVVFFYCGLIEVLTDAMLQQMRMLDARSPNDHVLRALSFGHYAQAAFQSPLTVKRTAVEYGIDDIVRFRDWLANAIEKEPHGRLARLGGAWMLRVSALLSRQGFGSVVLLPALAAAFDALEGRTDTGSTFRQFLAASAMSSIGHHERLLNVLDKATEPGVKAYLMHRLESITAGRKAELILDKRAKHLMGKIRRQLRRDFSQRIFDPKRRRKQ